ncbi:MAG TPA: SRPBCC family protein [Diaminobutyricibacter sp.]|uniref:SRPBCC family protein n=1 Tax=Leifsonia sp. McL0618 TaxID=3415677 RepID=UPI003378DF2E
MAHAAETVMVNRPIAEVFEFLADGMNEQKWRPEVVSIELVDGTGPGVGTTYAQSMKGPAGRTIKGDYRITRYEAPTRMDFETIAGPARPLGSFVLREIVPGTTEVTFTIDLTPKGAMVLMKGMITKQVASEAANIHNVPKAMGA